MRARLAAILASGWVIARVVGEDQKNNQGREFGLGKGLLGRGVWGWNTWERVWVFMRGNRGARGRGGGG